MLLFCGSREMAHGTEYSVLMLGSEVYRGDTGSRSWESSLGERGCSAMSKREGSRDKDKAQMILTDDHH
jgi:hypothetical protein